MAVPTIIHLMMALRFKCLRSTWSCLRSQISTVWRRAEMAMQTTKTAVKDLFECDRQPQLDCRIPAEVEDLCGVWRARAKTYQWTVG